jgi:type IV secretion system protein VirB9
MTVVTDRRTYMFDLVAGDKWTTPLYALKFSYPNDPAPEAKATQPVIAAAAPTVTPAIATVEKLHFDWKTRGDSRLLPERVFDDGQAVYLAWKRDMPLPAILTVSEDRKEGPVNYRMNGEYIVITPIPQNLLLRYGKKSAQLWPTHAVNVAPAVQPNAIAGTLPSGTVNQSQAAPRQVVPVQQQPAQQQAPATRTANSVKLANMTALYSDKLTDADNEH